MMVPVDNTVNSVIFFERENGQRSEFCASLLQWYSKLVNCALHGHGLETTEKSSVKTQREFVIFLSFSFCFRKHPSPALDSKRKSMGRKGESRSKDGRSMCEMRRGGVDLNCGYRGAPALAMPSATFDLLCSCVFVYLRCWGLNLGPSACSALRVLLSSTHASCPYQVISIMTELALTGLS